VKHVLFLAMGCVLIAAPAAHAQSPGVGVKVGLNVANLSTDEEDFNPKTRTGVVAGLFVVVPINSAVRFQPEFLYSQQGAKVEDGSDSGTIELDYFQVPLLARFRLGSGSPVGVLVGPSLGFRTRARIKANGETQDIKDDTESTDVGLVAGVSFEGGNSVVDVRYTWGLKDIDKDSTSSAKNRVFSASVGFRF